MSPEQAKGKTVDKRADIWAFGVVLFEMLRGRQLFTGETISETLAAVLMREPDFSTLPPNLHPRIRLLLERCLEKEPKNRYHDIADVRVDIQKALADPGGVFAQPINAISQTRPRTIAPWVAAAIVLTAIIAGVAVWKLKPAEPRQVNRFYYELPKDQQFGGTAECNIAVSPDGKQLVYGTSAGLYLRSMNELDAKLIPGSGENPTRPFFSPDSKWVGYCSGADNQLKKIAVSGGAPVPLTNAYSTGFFDWGSDDTIVYGQLGKGIIRVSANGGIPEVIVKAENEVLISPQILPDGKSVLFTLGSSTATLKVMLQSLKSGERKELFEGDTARYLPTGHIVYALANNLFAVPFDLDALKVAGGAIPVVEGVYRGAAPQYAVSDSGALAYVPGTERAAASGRSLVWVDRNGKEEPLITIPNTCRNPKISPDGTKVALDIVAPGDSPGNRDIWIWDLVRKSQTRLTLDPATHASPLWTPDGKRIVYFSRREGGSLYWKAADGTGKEEPVGSPPNGQIFPASWSDNGKTLIAMQRSLTTLSFDIGALSMEGDHKWKPLLKEKYYEAQAKISPDGRWMAYMSNESGQNQVYVRSFPEIDKSRSQVSTSGGDSPLWSPNARELFYRNGDTVMVVPFKIEPTFSPETPRVLFRGTYVSFRAVLMQVDFTPWDISPDGKRFLMMKEAGSAEGGPQRINIVMNWFEELKQRVPVK
jgi:Tol biopolymer transport system component